MSLFFNNLNGLVPHPCLGDKPSTIKKGWCTQRTIGLQKCPKCGYGVWNLHQPFRIGGMVCGYCFDEVESKGEPDYFQ